MGHSWSQEYRTGHRKGYSKGIGCLGGIEGDMSSRKARIHGDYYLTAPCIFLSSCSKPEYKSCFLLKHTL